MIGGGQRGGGTKRKQEGEKQSEGGGTEREGRTESVREGEEQREGNRERGTEYTSIVHSVIDSWQVRVKVKALSRSRVLICFSFSLANKTPSSLQQTNWHQILV